MKAGGAKVVVVGNEKGGSGKTTIAVHLAIGLSRLGIPVGSVDLDSHQQSLTRYLSNRRMWCEEHSVHLDMPEHRLIEPSSQDSRSAARRHDLQMLNDVLAALAETCRVVIVDCPAGDGFLSRAAHERADVLVTPLNDSFVDLDPLLQFRPGSFEPLALGGYARMLWEVREERLNAGRVAFDWIVLRNRLSGLADQNKKDMTRVLEKIAPIMGFHLAEGLGERIIFRRLFHQGLTLFDSDEPKTSIIANHSLQAARNELADLIDVVCKVMDIKDDVIVA
ncbi:division plane positioning ATPase MipZ [Telmatospirillum siberiense]|uniref:ATPase n=1 Tax=Telmatospirillum siberiense TaxID=382514 RepID=A0A2N3PWL2_9PROT|nr:division plane positioning ATPase MipZ [Telmatospirillum siberiense]PKU24765.1 ATPase [Telmatospirillum siberiense]